MQARAFHCVLNIRQFTELSNCRHRECNQGGVAEWARELTGDRTVNGSSPAVAIPFTPPCQCLSDETLKAVGPFYLVSMPGEVQYPTSPHWNV